MDDRSLFASKTVPDGFRRNLAVAPHLYAVPIDLAATIDIGEIQSEVPFDGSPRVPDELSAVPGEAGVIAVALPLPGPARFDRFPCRVVVGGSGPPRVITGMKLPWAAERQSGAAKIVQNNRLWRLCPSGVAEAGQTKDEYQPKEPAMRNARSDGQITALTCQVHPQGETDGNTGMGSTIAGAGGQTHWKSVSLFPQLADYCTVMVRFAEVVTFAFDASEAVTRKV